MYCFDTVNLQSASHQPQGQPQGRKPNTQHNNTTPPPCTSTILLHSAVYLRLPLAQRKQRKANGNTSSSICSSIDTCARASTVFSSLFSSVYMYSTMIVRASEIRRWGMRNGCDMYLRTSMQPAVLIVASVFVTFVGGADVKYSNLT